MLKLNASPPVRTTGATVSFVEQGGGALVGMYRASRLALSQTDLLTVDSVEADKATIAVEDTGAVTSVTLDGFTYTLSEGEAAPGTFNWNPDTGTVTLNLAEGHQPQASATAIVQTLGDRYLDEVPTGEVTDPAPDWFKTWNIQGSFRWSRSFSDQPSGGFSFITAASNEADVRSRLQVGKQFIAYGVGFSVSGLAIVRIPKQINPGKFIQVEVSLTGYHVEALNRTIKLKRAVRGARQSTLSEIATAAGTTYSGETIELNLSANISDAEQTTFAQEIGDRAISGNGFPFFSSPYAVEVRRWRTTRLHVVSLVDVLSPIQISISGSKAHFQAQQQDNRLSDEYRNTVLTLDRDAREKDYQQNLSIWIEDSDDNYQSPPPEFIPGISSQSLTLENFSNNHDAGGVTKERTRTLYRNSTVLKVIKEKWGFAYRGIDVYRYSVSSSQTSDPIINWYRYNPSVMAAVWWRKVEESTEFYNYNPQDGYLLSVPTQTSRLSRLKQEQDAKESIAAETTPTVYKNGVLVKDGENLRRAYQFNWQTESDTTSYTLASYLGLYPDIKRPKDDEDWVEPKYAAEVKRVCAQTFQGGTIDPNKPAPLAGRAFSEVKRVIVNYPYQGTSEENWNPELEMYTVKSRTQNQQGESLRDTLKIGTRSENLGRPSTHTRIELVSNNPMPPAPKQPGQQKTVKALLNTPNNGVTPNDPQEGNISFPGVTSYSKGRECAQTQISIANTKGVETWQFTVAHHAAKRFEEGDRLSLMGKLLVIFSMEEELDIASGLVVSRGITISAGLFVDPPITLTFDESVSS